MAKTPQYINHQADDYIVENVPMKEISFGLGNISDNGCGVIAAYNVALSQGLDVTFSQVKKDIIKLRGLNLFGILGVNPFAIKRFLKKNFPKAWYVKTGKKMWEENGEHCSGVIVLVKWKKSLRMHYMAGIKDEKNNTFKFFNSGIRDENRGSIDGKSVSMQRFFECARAQRAMPLCIFGITDKSVS